MIPIILQGSQKEVEVYIKDTATKLQISPSFIFRITPIKTEFSIQEVRELRAQLKLSSEKRLFILESFDTASLEAQNALLKVLEEKSERNMFILLVQSVDAMLATVRSRCNTIVLDKPSQEPTSKYASVLDEVLSSSNYEFLQKIEPVAKEDIKPLMDSIILLLRDRLSTTPSVATLLKQALRMKERLVYNNTQTQLTVDALLIQVKKQLKSSAKSM